MNFHDAVRWVVIFGCAGSLGFMIALYDRVGRLIVPRLWTRMLVASNIGFLTILAIGVHAKLGSPTFTWRTTTFGVLVLMQLIAELGLFRWYGGARGREHVRRMTEGRDGGA